MPPTIKTRMQLDAEKEFKSAVKDINTELKTLSTEMKKVSATFQENADSTEALSAKGEVLEKQLTSQKEKVNELQEALNHAKENYGENSSEVQKWQQQLNNAETDVLNTEKAIRDNNSALQDATKATGELGSAEDSTAGKTTGLGDTVNGLTQKLGISLPQGVTDSLNSMVSLDAGMLGMIATFAAVAAVVYELEKALVELTTEQAAAADEILTNSVKFSQSTERLQEYAYASELVDTSTETITGAMTKLNRTMDDASKGNKDLAETYKKLGVSVTDRKGELRDVDDVFWETIDALGKMDNAAERDAIAMDLMGRSAKDLNPLIAVGSEGMRGFAKEAHEMGYVLDDEALKALGNVDDAMQRMKNSTEAAKNQVAVQFAPALENFYNMASGGIQALGEFAEESGLVALFGALLDIFSALEPAADILLDILGEGTGSVLQPLILALSLVADVLTIILSSIGAIIESVKILFGGGDINRLRRYEGNISRVFSDEGATARALGIGQNADGTQDWRGGLTWVGERGPEIVNLPQGSQVIPNEAIGGTNNYYLNVNARDMSTVARMTATFDRVRQEGRAR